MPITRIEYDERGRKIKHVRGYNKWEFQYNDEDSLIQQKWFYWDDWTDVEHGWRESLCIKEFKYENNRLVSKIEVNCEGLVNDTITTTYFYDETGNKTKSLETGFWRIVEYEFDHNNNLISETVSTREDYRDSAFLKESQTVFSYNEKNNVTREIRYGWKGYSERNRWIEKWQREYIYDLEGDLLLRTESKSFDAPDFGLWKYSMTEYGYDEHNRNISETWYYRYSEKNIWEKRMKYEFHYDEQGNLILEILSHWKKDVNDWVAYHQRDWMYNEKGDKTLFVNKVNKSSDSKKEEYFYDDNGNLTFQINYEWDKENSVWKKFYTEKFFYSKRAIVQRNE